MNGDGSKPPTAPPLPLRGTSPKGGSEGLYEFALDFLIGILRTAGNPSGAVRRLPFQGRSKYPKNFPQGVWNVETGAVEKFTSKHLETLAVDKLLFLPFVLWIKSPRKSCAFGTFPHKLLLLPLLLPKPIDR